MKFDQLIECDVRNIFTQKPCRKFGRETSFRSFFTFKAIYKVKTNAQHLSFDIFW